MLNTEKAFFTGKREWSKLKDEVLINYLRPYLKKVNTLGRSIILVDTFAGPGQFDDGEKGSPYYFCNIANELVPNNYTAILVNRSLEHHLSLNSLLASEIKNGKAITIHGTSNDLLKELHRIIKDQTILIYLDPFGLKGTDFETLKHFLSRDKTYSTELIINLSIPTIIRNTCVNTISREGINDVVKSKHLTIKKALGSDFLKDNILDANVDTKTRIRTIINEYIKKLRLFLPYVYYCPVNEKTEDSRLKYIIIFASRHLDAVLLMNDIMFKAYWKKIYKAKYENTLFGELDWSEGLPNDYYDNLRQIIKKNLSTVPISRQELWSNIVKERFMRFQKKDFNSVLRTMLESELDFIDIRGTGKLNDDALIKIKQRL